jgi:hypothetical protein
MSGIEIDSALTGIIVILIIVLVWKWHVGGSCGTGLTLSCGCYAGKCKCKGTSWGPMKGSCGGGKSCPCGCKSGSCGCPSSCMCQRKARSQYKSVKEGYKSANGLSMEDRDKIAASGGNVNIEDPAIGDGDYADVVKNMSLEADVGSSHKRYCDSLSFSGMPTGASSCTELEETGRDANSANFVGLTARKFCRAAALAVPGVDARQTTSYDRVENCNISADSLI